MKTTILKFIVFIFITNTVLGQNKNIREILINENVSTHFTSTQNIDYTDISTNNVAGDMPLPNILRIKPVKDLQNDLGFVTIVGEDFFVQYRLTYTPDSNKAHKNVDLDKDAFSFKNSKYPLTSEKLRAFSILMSGEKPSLNNVIARKDKMQIRVNNIWVIEDYIFVDFTLLNQTNLKYDIDEIRYKIIDKKITKAENNQDQEIQHVYMHNTEKSFDKQYKNIIAFDKFTFPDQKSFIIEITEKQISGRTITAHIAYSDILNAKSFN